MKMKESCDKTVNPLQADKGRKFHVHVLVESICIVVVVVVVHKCFLRQFSFQPRVVLNLFYISY